MPIGLPPLKTWNSICLLKEARAAAKLRTEDLVRTRKVIDQDLDRLGSGNTTAHLQKSRDLVICLRALQFHRDQQRQLADQVDSAIQAGINGEIVEVDAKTLSVTVDEASLFHARESDEEDDETPPLPGIEANRRMDAEANTFKIPKGDATKVGSAPVTPPKGEESGSGGPVAKVGKKSRAKTTKGES